MKTSFTKFLLPLLVTLSALFATNACVIHTQPVDSVYAVQGPPPQIYYGGRDLVYRSDGYYYYDRGGWIVAPAVPSYVSTYHRPAYRPGYGPSYYRPTYSRPAYMGSTTRPLHVNSGPSYNRPPANRPNTSGPVHVNRPSGQVTTPHGSRPTQDRRINSR